MGESDGDNLDTPPSSHWLVIQGVMKYHLLAKQMHLRCFQMAILWSKKTQTDKQWLDYYIPSQSSKLMVILFFKDIC